MLDYPVLPKPPIFNNSLHSRLDVHDITSSESNFLGLNYYGEQKAPPYSSEAIRIAFAYDEWLDDWGRKQVGDVVNNEITRCKALKQTRKPQSEAAEVVYFKVPEYALPMSAGTGEVAGQEEPEDFLLIKAPPRGTSYVARVSGDSMEPTYHDGDRIFVRATLDIQPGQIGVFFMDGKMWVKELGDNILISHNPAYTPIPMREDIKCQGLVLGVCDESYFE